jgi:hypothetical protein
MTLAVPAPTSTQTVVPQTVPIVVLGADALLAALPATPVQLAHACLRAGFANVIPASWGDELIAAAVLRRLPQFAGGPVIQCSCPFVAHRLLAAGGDLRAAMVALVPPPVAIARYVRTLSQPTKTRITYVGSCPGANDDAIDIRMRPEALLAMLAERNIALEDQPRVFESIIPPDRRRFRSQPGGVPAADTLWTEHGSRALVEVDGDDFVTEVAQHLLSGKNVLIDVSARLGCACSGAVPGVAAKDARPTVVALEPPRATTPVVEEQAPIDLELVVPAAARTPVEVGAVPPNATPAKPVFPPAGGLMPHGHSISPVRGVAAVPEARPPRPSGQINPRPVLGAFPVTRDVEGKSLPRTYVARRRSSPKGLPAITLPPEDPPSVSALGQASQSPPRPEPALPPAASPPVTAPVTAPVTPPMTPPVLPTWDRLPMSFTPRQLVLVVISLFAIVLSMSVAVAVIVGRLVR